MHPEKEGYSNETHQYASTNVRNGDLHRCRQPCPATFGTCGRGACFHWTWAAVASRCRCPPTSSRGCSAARARAASTGGCVTSARDCRAASGRGCWASRCIYIPILRGLSVWGLSALGTLPPLLSVGPQLVLA